MLKICRNTFNIRLNLHLHKEVLHINRWGTVSTSCRWRLGTVMGCGGTIPTTGVSTSFLHFRFLVLFRVLLVFTLANGLYQLWSSFFGYLMCSVKHLSLPLPGLQKLLCQRWSWDILQCHRTVLAFNLAEENVNRLNFILFRDNNTIGNVSPINNTNVFNF